MPRYSSANELVTASKIAPATAQAIAWRYEKWRSWLPGPTAEGPAWQRILCDLHDACTGSDCSITRTDVIAFGQMIASANFTETLSDIDMPYVPKVQQPVTTPSGPPADHGSAGSGHPTVRSCSSSPAPATTYRRNHWSTTPLSPRRSPSSNLAAGRSPPSYSRRGSTPTTASGPPTSLLPATSIPARWNSPCSPMAPHYRGRRRPHSCISFASMLASPRRISYVFAIRFLFEHAPLDRCLQAKRQRNRHHSTAPQVIGLPPSYGTLHFEDSGTARRVKASRYPGRVGFAAVRRRAWRGRGASSPRGRQYPCRETL